MDPNYGRVSGGNVYRTACFHCNAEFNYYERDIHHNHWLNNRVRSHGFRGFTGEVRCPNCGTFLAHYDQNRIS
ncbi:MAG: hypothetical protein IKE48_04525 [Parasporobacterium sp.]|nr:hypothetical protein [Parasporobacterium sp.]